MYARAGRQAPGGHSLALQLRTTVLLYVQRGRGLAQGLIRSVLGVPHEGSWGPLQYDLTELSGLDFLGSPTGCIHEAQRMAARAFGAEHTWFLVNGSTVGIHAAVMAAARPGDTLLLARNAHQSAFAAMALAGAATARRRTMGL